MCTKLTTLSVVCQMRVFADTPLKANCEVVTEAHELVGLIFTDWNSEVTAVIDVDYDTSVHSRMVQKGRLLPRSFFLDFRFFFPAFFCRLKRVINVCRQLPLAFKPHFLLRQCNTANSGCPC